MTQATEYRKIIEDFNSTVEQANYCIENYNRCNFNYIDDFRRAEIYIGDIVRIINMLSDLANKACKFDREGAAKMQAVVSNLYNIHSDMFNNWNKHPNWMRFAR